MKLKRSYSLLIGAAIFILLLSYAMKIMHWPGSMPLVLIGFTTIILVYPRLVLLNKNRTKTDVIKVLSIFIWGGFGIVYILLYPENKFLYSAISKTGLIMWLILFFYEYLIRNYSETTYTNILIKAGYIVGGCGLAVGFFFRTMHWPGAKILLIISAVITGLTFFFTTFVQDEDERNLF